MRTLDTKSCSQVVGKRLVDECGVPGALREVEPVGEKPTRSSSRVGNCEAEFALSVFLVDFRETQSTHGAVGQGKLQLRGLVFGGTLEARNSSVHLRPGVQLSS